MKGTVCRVRFFSARPVFRQKSCFTDLDFDLDLDVDPDLDLDEITPTWAREF